VEAARAATAAAVRREHQHDVNAHVYRDDEGNVWDWGDIEQRLGALQHSLRTPPPGNARTTPAQRALPTPPSRGGSYAKQFSAAAVGATPTPGGTRTRKGKAVAAAASPAVRRAGGWAH